MQFGVAPSLFQKLANYQHRSTGCFYHPNIRNIFCTLKILYNTTRHQTQLENNCKLSTMKFFYMKKKTLLSNFNLMHCMRQVLSLDFESEHWFHWIAFHKNPIVSLFHWMGTIELHSHFVLHWDYWTAPTFCSIELGLLNCTHIL